MWERFLPREVVGAFRFCLLTRICGCGFCLGSAESLWDKAFAPTARPVPEPGFPHSKREGRCGSPVEAWGRRLEERSPSENRRLRAAQSPPRGHPGASGIPTNSGEDPKKTRGSLGGRGRKHSAEERTMTLKYPTTSRSSRTPPPRLGLAVRRIHRTFSSRRSSRASPGRWSRSSRWHSGNASASWTP